jgi:membrane protein
VKTLSKIKDLIEKSYDFITVDIWRLDFSKLSKLQTFFVHQVLFIYFVIRAFIKDRLLVRASALVYATLLSLVPLLAIVFSLLKVFGFHNKLGPTLEKLVAPLGQESATIVVKTILQFVDNISVGALGGVGLLVLFASVLSIINNIDGSFNDIWHVKRGRSYKRRFMDYFSVLFIGPVLLFAILGITASMQSNSVIQTVSNIPGLSIVFNRTAPIVASWIVFYFLVAFAPNTKERFTSAILGAILGGTIWQIANRFFALFIVSSYQSGAKAALYAGFATFPLFLVWLYLSWSIVLIAAEISYAHQNLHKITWDVRNTHFSYALRETLVLKFIVFISGHFFNGKEAPTSLELSNYFKIPERLTNNILFEMVDVGLLFKIEGQNLCFTVAKSPNNLSVADVFFAMRNHGLTKSAEITNGPISSAVNGIYNSFEDTIIKSFGDTKIVDLIKDG